MKAVGIFISGVIVGALLAAAFNTHANTSCYPLNDQHGLKVCMGGRA